MASSVLSKTVKLAGASRTANKALLYPCVRSISGKRMRAGVPPADKPLPFPYETKEFTGTLMLLTGERTISRFDENSKLIVVEGADCIGKSKFAKELAEELEFMHFEEPNHDQIYVSPYGVDVRQYRDYFTPWNIPYDEADFARDPTGPVPGSADRYQKRLFDIKLLQYIFALRHIFNTGQGVVIEKSPYSHYVFMDALVNAGWMTRASRRYTNEIILNILPELLRPNLVIYLDAPPEVTQKNIKARGYKCDVDSPVWANKQFLLDQSNAMKRDYLKKIQNHTEVLCYDWSEPGETEIVVEDIERLNLDFFGYLEEKQKDWRMHDDEFAAELRMKYSMRTSILSMLQKIATARAYEAEHMLWPTEDNHNMADVLKQIEGNRYTPGYNTDHGDPEPLLREAPYRAFMNGWYLMPQPEFGIRLQGTPPIEPSHPKPVRGE